MLASTSQQALGSAVVPELELVVVFTSKWNVSSEVSNTVLGALDELLVAIVRASR